MNLIYNPVYSKPGKAEDAELDIEAARKDPDFQGGGSGMGAPYHVRVLIPCYKEPFEIVQRTVSAIRDAVLPAGEGIAQGTALADEPSGLPGTCAPANMQRLLGACCPPCARVSPPRQLVRCQTLSMV